MSTHAFPFTLLKYPTARMIFSETNSFKISFQWNFRIRGQLGSAFAVICNIGILLEFVMAKYLDFYTISKIVIAVSILTTIAFSFVPESPQFLISKSRIEDAEKSYRFFRGFKKSEIIPVECSIEFNNMRTSISKTTTGDSKIRHLIRHLCSINHYYLNWLKCN